VVQGTIADIHTYSEFFLRLAIGFYMLIFQPPVNFCSDENIQTIFGTKLEDFLNYRIDYNSISQTVLIEIPVFSHTAFYGTFRSAVFFHSNFLCLLR
jgi:hypothetical protein